MKKDESIKDERSERRKICFSTFCEDDFLGELQKTYLSKKIISFNLNVLVFELTRIGEEKISKNTFPYQFYIYLQTLLYFHLQRVEHKTIIVCNFLLILIKKNLFAR